MKKTVKKYPPKLSGAFVIGGKNRDELLELLQISFTIMLLNFITTVMQIISKLKIDLL